jgi:hypothetical protein
MRGLDVHSVRRIQAAHLRHYFVELRQAESIEKEARAGSAR